MIGIAITTRNRPEVLRYTLAKFWKFWDLHTSIVVVDDNSKCYEENKDIVDQYGFRYLYNKERLGIPKSKDRGFQYLKICDYQFWFDDDCFPKCANWTEPFIDTMEYQGHLLYLRDWSHIHPVLHVRNVVEYTGATACLMTFRKDMYKDVEGFWEGYSLYGHWHANLSQRMYKKGYGFTKYATLCDVERYIWAFDLDGKPKDFKHEFSSCMSNEERQIEGQKGLK